MKIEQRALDIITDNVLLRKNTPKVRGAIRDALIQIATEQKAEDINKGCEIVRNLANEHFGDWGQSCKVEDAFRNAMEE